MPPPKLPQDSTQLDTWREGISSHSPEETIALAKNLARLLPENTTLGLYGDLGSGKTTFVRGLASAWAITTPVTSPTYAIFTIHDGPQRQLIHMDAYRLNAPSESDSLVLWDLLREPWVLVVEWPEKLGDRLPEKHWALTLTCNNEDTRHLKLTHCNTCP
ncbi:MAG: tRNA (adenosine(37)-N6)-threonylcarbamoyltransferase complex ATPase subunit type 1 TsaE [Puniceicoccales bacterium]|jgi:tRNA threonylcarbamoyladenosine biosynthesis protein TsaE|nr:tRNA (adenosine(37)-N6)-threonylcarbamoyltransferase complex ATPase subunit type 1 TsaE [Puniceicoccales bacterium]